MTEPVIAASTPTPETTSTAPAPPETAPAPAEVKPPPKADAWAAIASKERHLSAREAELKARATELAARETSLSDGGTKAERERIKALATAGRFDELESEFGISYQQWTKAKLSKGRAAAPADAPLSKDAVAKLVADSIKADREEQAAAETKRRDEQASAHWSSLMSELPAFVAAAGEKFELIAAEMAYRPKHVEDVLREMASIDPSMLVPAALERLEAHLLKRATDLVGSSKKLAALRGSPTTAPKNEDASSPKERSGHVAGEGGPRTLTNLLAADGAHAAPPPRPHSKGARIAAEREAEAAEIRRIAATLG